MIGAGRGPGGPPQETSFEVASLDARPELAVAALDLLAVGWPEFMQHDPVAERHQGRLATELARFQVLLLDDKDELTALGVAIPFAWDGTLAGLPAGWDAVVTQGVADLDARRRRPPWRRSRSPSPSGPPRPGPEPAGHPGPQGRRGPGRAGHAAGAGAPVGQERLPPDPDGAVRALGPARRRPVRPLAAHPLAARGEVLGVCPASMEITAEVAAWEAWTGLAFPETGPYVVPGALVPVVVDQERDLGRYVEPNVWLRHRCGADLPT